jgi:hypothetical protein
MNTVWQMSPQDILKEWRQFRKSIEHLDDRECLQKVVDWWKYTPISSRVIDPYDSKDWPDPWELMYSANFDENAIALGIAYTLHLMDWSCDLLLVQNTDNNFLGLVVSVDDQYILNYNYEFIESSDILEVCQILKKWNTNELT